MNFKSKKYREKAHQIALRNVRSSSDRLHWLARFRRDPETPRWLIKWEQVHLAMERKFQVDPLLFLAAPPEDRPLEQKAYRAALLRKYVEPLAVG